MLAAGARERGMQMGCRQSLAHSGLVPASLDGSGGRNDSTQWQGSTARISNALQHGGRVLRHRRALALALCKV